MALNEEEKTKLAEQYQQRYTDFFKRLVEIVAELQSQHDALGMVFIAETVEVLLLDAMNKIGVNRELPGKWN